ncbi:MAG: hypothetical protein KG029_10845 [Bacteroidetes bacterium]|nr:hypothetical protein [Bacteroidota bacterium]
MTDNPEWLPPLILLKDSEGDWDTYLDKIYQVFRRDFVARKPVFRGIRLALKRHPISEGKEATFWHIISEGKDEQNRTPDLRRCERMGWPCPIIEMSDGDHNLRVWENQRDDETRICIWLSFDGEDYLVVLAKRKEFVLLWTAYPLTYPHQKRKLQREYEAYMARAAL